MIKINKDSATNQLVFQATDADRTHWLIVAQSVLSCAEKVFIIELTNLSTKCLKFVITDNPIEDPLLATMDFASGDWAFDFYKQPLATQETNLDRLLATFQFSKTGEVLGTTCPSQSSPAICPPVTVIDTDMSVNLIGAGGEFTCTVSCADAVYENSDQSFQQNIASGDTFVAADVNNIDSDGSTIPTPANIPFVATLCTGVTPTGINYARSTLTGQIIIFNLHDDAWQTQNGIKDYTIPPNPLYTQRLDRAALSPFLTLNFDNAFGNKDRFTDSEGGQIFGAGNSSISDYVVDNLTGLAWGAALVTSTTWSGQLSNSQTFTLGGFTDFFVPDRNQFEDILNHNPDDLSVNNNLLSYSIFNHTQASIWLSTSDVGGTTFAFRCTSIIRDIGTLAKTTSTRSIFYRVHF